MTKHSPEPAACPLLIRYTDTATTAYKKLEHRFQRTLVQAVALLAADPMVPESRPVEDDESIRRVHASQSLALEYRIFPTYLVIDNILYTPRGEAPATVGAANVPSVQWERVATIAPASLVPPVARHAAET